MSASHGSPGWLAGTGRSGTTWLGNVMHGITPCKQKFEPLNPERVRFPVALQPRPASGVRPWLDPDSDNAGWRAFIADVLNGTFDNRWTRYGHSGWKQRPRIWFDSLRAKHVVVKEVRSNLLLGWLAKQMNLRPVLLVRHPCATVASQLQRNWRTDITPLISDARLIEEHFREHASYLRNELTTDVQRLAARWAIENLVPFRQATRLPILVVTYEDAVLDPVAVAKKIAAHWRWPVDEHRDEQIIRRAAAGVSGLSHVAGPEQLLAAWKKKQPRAQSEAILEVTRRLGFEMYDMDVLPRRASPAVSHSI
jgi:hypothetical protein